MTIRRVIMSWHPVMLFLPPLTRRVTETSEQCYKAAQARMVRILGFWPPHKDRS